MKEDCKNKKYLHFLDDLRMSGEINMFETVPYLIDEFDVNEKFATAILMHWINTFTERKNKGELNEQN